MTAKMLYKTNWFKERSEVEPPASNPQGEKSGDKTPSSQGADDIISSQTEHQPSNQQGGSVDPSGDIEFDEAPSTNVKVSKHRGDQNWRNPTKKKRGRHRKSVTLGGIKKMEKASKRKERQRVNRMLGRMDVPTNKKRVKRGPPPPTISVCFIDNIKNGILVKRMQEGEVEIGGRTDFRVRMAEAAGTPLSLILTNNNPWGNMDCERQDCVPCGQPDEKRIDCKKRNIMYESYCTVCNPEEAKRGKMDEITFLKAGRGIYVGESARSLYERTKEHMADRVGLKEESHQVKHWLTEHRELQEPPPFKYRLVRTFKDPMSRQLSEAVRIELRGEGILNSKAEFNRCKVPRLKIDLEGWKKEKLKESCNQLEDCHEMEASLEEKGDVKRKTREEEPKVQRRAKRIRMERLEGWGENEISTNDGEEILPEGWWREPLYREIDNTRVPEVGITIENEIDGVKIYKDNGKAEKKNEKFKFKKKGKLKDSEMKELKRTNQSLLGWVRKTEATPNSPAPLPMNKTQEETDDMEWEELEREEKLERVERKKREWTNIRMCRSIVLDLVGETVSWVKEKPWREVVEEMVDEGWRRLETSRILLMFSNTEPMIKMRVEENILERRAEEQSMLLAIRVYEEKQKRLDRIDVLKMILSKKLGAARMREILRMMKRMSLGDLEMNVDCVEDLALEMMETGEEGSTDTDQMDFEDLNLELEKSEYVAMNIPGGLRVNDNNFSNKEQPQTTISGIKKKQLGQLPQQLQLEYEVRAKKRKRESDSWYNTKRWRGPTNPPT